MSSISILFPLSKFFLQWLDADEMVRTGGLPAEHLPKQPAEGDARQVLPVDQGGGSGLR